jgi:hypothetical protein
LAVFVPILKGKLAANSSITRHFLDKAEIHHGWHHNIRTYIYIYSILIYIYMSMYYVCKLYFSWFLGYFGSSKLDGCRWSNCWVSSCNNIAYAFRSWRRSER